MTQQVQYETFRRGPGPLISILFCTRGRPQGLREAVQALEDRAGDRNQIEYVFKVDDDDLETLQVIKELGSGPLLGRATLLTSPRGRGYAEIPGWLNEMGKVARGDWLFIYNSDDSLMISQDWDRYIEFYPVHNLWHRNHDICLLFAMSTNREGGICVPLITDFIIIRREVFNLLGRFSPEGVTNADNWLYSVLNMLGSAFILRTVVIKHYQDDDPIRLESGQPRYDSGQLLQSPWGIRERMKDVEKLLTYIERCQNERRGNGSTGGATGEGNQAQEAHSEPD